MIRLASALQHDSIVDGKGLRTVIWCQGCIHQCIDCHNPDTWDIEGGQLVNINELVEQIKKDCWYKAITFSGGDPFLQAEECFKIAKKLKKYDFNIWCYTGFLYEDLIDNPIYLNFLSYIDVLVDGQFIKKLKSYDLEYRGSKNQRLINVQESLKQNKIILM